MSSVSLQKLFPSEFAQDSRDALRAVLESPPGTADVIKDESRTLIWKALLPSGTPAIVKTYRKRSLYDFSRESLTRFRAQREFDSLSFLSRSHVPCARPVCWGYGRDTVSGRFESLVTVQEGHVVGLKDYLRSQQADDRWIGPAARLVRQGHDIGFYHGALAPRNMLLRLVDGQDVSCMFIDTPKSIIFPRPITGSRMATHDLRVLLVEVYHVAGESPLTEFLAIYGAPRSRILGMVDDIKRYRANRNTRNRMRAEFLARRLVSRR